MTDSDDKKNFMNKKVDCLEVLNNLVKEREEELRQDYSEAFDRLLCDFAETVAQESDSVET